MTTEEKSYEITCRGKEYIADSDYFRDSALSLEDCGTALTNPRLNFIIYNFEHFKIKREYSKKQRGENTVEFLYSLSKEMNRVDLSYEDEQYLDEIMGNDPMCMF